MRNRHEVTPMEILREKSEAAELLYCQAARIDPIPFA
jgi:hypothetical protein